MCISQVSVFGSAETRLCTPIVFQVMSFICQSNHQIIGSLSIAITIPSPTITIPSPTIPHSISVTTIAVVGVSFWLWLGGSLAVAVFVSGVVGPSFTIIAAMGWCRVGRCLLFEGDAKQK